MDLWTILGTIIGGAFLINWFFTRNFNHFINRGIPYLKPKPIFGNMAGVVFGTELMQGTVQKAYDMNPDAKYVGFFDFSVPIIILKDLELVKSITTKNFDSFPNHRLFAESPTEPLFDKNLFALKDDAWRDMRALLSPAFTSSKMKMMFKMMSQCAVDFSDHLAKLDPKTEELDMKETFGRYTLDVIATTAFGLSVNSMKDRENEFYLLGKSVSDFSGIKTFKFFVMKSLPWFAKLFNIRLVDDKTSNFFTTVIKSTIAARDAQGIVRPDMIHLMMQARDRKEKSSLSPEDMTAQAFVFLLGGFDSPAITMSFAAHLLALNPDVQRKLQAEIDRVLEQSSGEVSYEDLHAMKYLDNVINETLRMFSPAGFLDRIGPKSFTLPPALPGLEPLKIEPGQNVWIPVHSFHRDQKYFPNPDEFDPERFNEENKSKINFGAYMPFGAGPRICIANRFALMEVKLALFHVLAKCNFVQTAKTPNPIKFSTNSFSIAPEGGFLVKIEPRK